MEPSPLRGCSALGTGDGVPRFERRKSHGDPRCAGCVPNQVALSATVQVRNMKVAVCETVTPSARGCMDGDSRVFSHAR